ncbi:MAG: gliding motility-associated C-terminal domain-containing protein [Chitinophagaceae bacterium]|nr:gliding motility-associated C-terminal domain-containing protein [Chitinophagaceae bacterium]
MLFGFSSIAQLCPGSLGDPLININFGSGANPGGPLAAASTAYQYVANDCPGDGFYTVRNNTTACFGNSWHSLNSDHTGDPNGYFMLVNASLQPSAFYVDTLRGLCSNISYEFAAWVINVVNKTACGGNAIQPNLDFRIEKTDGTLLQSYNSGNISTDSLPTWKQYGFYFTTPAGVSDIVLRIVNNAAGGCGNDLALDDITLRPCGPRLTPGINGITSDTAHLCEGKVRTFNLNCTVSAGFINPVYQWQQRFNGGPWLDIPGANTTAFSPQFLSLSPPGIYGYRMNVSESGNPGLQCRVSSKILSIIVHAIPVATASNNGPVCSKTVLTLTANGASQYFWTGPNGFLASGASVSIGNIQPNQSGIYFVLATDTYGCVDTAFTFVQVNASPIPITSFSDSAICLGDSIQFFASGGIGYAWQPAAGLNDTAISNPKASPLSTTRYRVVVRDAIGCRDTAYINLEVSVKPSANAGPDKSLVLGRSATLEGSYSGTITGFSWSPPAFISDIRSLRPVVTPPGDATYILNVSSRACPVATDTVQVKWYKALYVPNAFSPNGDGKNDNWYIPALGAYPDFELSVFNRFGQKVFESRKDNRPWDGRMKGSDLPVGTYVYFIRLNVGDETLSGTVILLR